MPFLPWEGHWRDTKVFFFISICISMEWNIFLCALKMRFNTKVPFLSLFNTYITALTWKTMMIWFFCHFSECLCLLLPHTASFGCLKEVTACFSWENFGQAHINNTSTGPRTVKMVRFLLFSPQLLTKHNYCQKVHRGSSFWCTRTVWTNSTTVGC